MKKIFFIILFLFNSCSLGVQGGGTVGQAFTGIETIQGLSPNSIRIKWVKPQGYNNFTIYGGKEDEELTLRGSTRLSSMTLNNLSPGSSYRFAVEATQEKTNNKFGKQNIKYFNTWNNFQGVASLSTLSAESIQAVWGFDTEEGMTYEVYISEGETNPNLFDGAHLIVQDTLVNITDLKPSTKYNIIVRAIYPNGEKDTNSKILSTSTESSVSMPSVLIDNIVLGKRPTMRAVNIEQGVKVYILHYQYEDLNKTVHDKGNIQVAGPISSNGIFQVNQTYRGFLPGVHKLKIRVTKDIEDIILNQVLTFRVRALIEDKWNIVKTDYSYPQRLGSSNSLNITVGSGSNLEIYRPISYSRPLASGDFNGDGVDDLAIGLAFSTKERNNDNNRYAKGFAIVFYGVEDYGLRINVEPSLTPLSSYDPLIIESTYEDNKAHVFQQAYFGYSMDGGKFVKKQGSTRLKTGDINNDGYSDLIISAPSTTLHSDSKTYHYDVGVVYIYYGSSNGIVYTDDYLIDVNNSCYSGICENLIIRSPIYDIRPSDLNDYSFFGARAAHLGDINGDGYGDIAISAPGTFFSIDTSYGRAAGEVYIYYGSENGLIVKYGEEPNLNQPPIRITTKGVYSSACQAGLVPSCSNYDFNTTNPDILNTGLTTATAQQFGNDIAGGINITNTSGYPELVISAPGFGVNRSVGKVFIFYNHNQGIGSIGTGFKNFITIDPPNGIYTGTNTLDGLFFGYTLETVPDVNGDGYGELVVSIGYNSTIQSGTRKEGIVVYYGKAGGVFDNDSTCNTHPRQYKYNIAACTSTPLFCCPQYLDFPQCTPAANNINLTENTSYWRNRDPIASISAADFDGDGVADLILGRPWFDTDTNLQNTGRACILKGSIGTGFSAYDYTLTDSRYNEVNQYYGSGLAAGDFTGKGKDSIAVSTPNAIIEGRDLNGVISIYHDYNFSQTLSTSNQQIDGHYIGQLQSIEQVPLHVGDINGDGYDDIAVKIRYYYNNILTYGIVIIYGSDKGLILSEATYAFDPIFLSPQLFLPIIDVGSNPRTDICRFIIPIGDVNGDGNDDIYCYDWHNYNGMVLFGSGLGLTTGTATAYKDRNPGETNPQLFYDHYNNSGQSRGHDIYQAFTFRENDVYKGLGNFNGDKNPNTGYSYGDVAFSNPLYGYYSNYHYKYYGNVWVAYGSSKGLQEPSNRSDARVDVPYKTLTDLYHAHAAFCYTDELRMNIGADLQRVCTGIANHIYDDITCTLQQLAGFDAKVQSGACDISGKEISPPGFGVLNINYYFGSSLTTIDYNNDGIDDLVVGASHINDTLNSIPRAESGRVYFYKGTPYGLVYDENINGTGFINFEDFYVENTYYNYNNSTPGLSNRTGSRVSNAGDVNGDGYDDLIVGAANINYRYGLNFLIYGGAAGLQLNNGYIIDENNSCDENGVCKILVFRPPMTTNSFCVNTIGVGNINGGSYDDVLVNCYQRSIHNGTAIDGLAGTGESFLYTGGPRGLVVEGLQNQPNYSNTPMCIGGVCTPYNFYPQGIAKTYRQYGVIMVQSSKILGTDFNGDGLNDFIVPLGITSKYESSSYVGGFFVFY